MTRRMRCGLQWGTMMLCAFILSCGSPEHPATQLPRQLNLYIWASYIDPTVLEQFQKETGVSVRVVTYPSQETLLTVLLAGHTQNDVVDVSSEQLQYLAGNGVFQQLDRTQLKNWNNLDEAILDQLSQLDPGNHVAVPYLWGTTGLALNVTKIKQVAPAVSLDSWSLLFDPAKVAQVAHCGVFFTDAPNDVTSTVLLYLGKDPNSSATQDLDQAAEQLMNVRRSIRRIDSDGQINDLTSGEICAELAWTPVLVQAKRRTKEVGSQSELRFVIPREGAMSYIDALAIPKDAPHSTEAHQFIDSHARRHRRAQCDLYGRRLPQPSCISAARPCGARRPVNLSIRRNDPDSTSRAHPSTGANPHRDPELDSVSDRILTESAKLLGMELILRGTSSHEPR